MQVEKNGSELWVEEHGKVEGERKDTGGSSSFRCLKKIENSGVLKILCDLGGPGWIPAPEQLLVMDLWARQLSLLLKM